MIDVIKSISVERWIEAFILLISFLALFISILAYRRSGKSNTVIATDKDSVTANAEENEKPILERYKSIDVSIMLTARRNAKDQLRLVLKNTGVVTARDIDLVIGEPIRVIKNEELVNGISESVVVNDSALKPRLTVIDAKVLFPITEISPGVVFDIFAVTTMGYGKICDFPISISWIDDRGTRHFQDEVVTI